MTVAAVPGVWLGWGAFTVVVFLPAAYGLGITSYRRGHHGSGFAGSFVVILFLAYFLSMVFLYGAEVTKAYTDRLVGGGRPGGHPADVQPPPGCGSPAMAGSAGGFLAFVAGLIAGWRRSRR